jgi:hypothetical protein
VYCGFSFDFTAIHKIRYAGFKIPAWVVQAPGGEEEVKGVLGFSEGFYLYIK